MDEKPGIGLKQRLESYEEIVPGLSKKEAIEEAKRCLQCQEPKCMLGCPAGVNCKELIRLLAQEEKLEEAKKLILLHNSAPCITSRVCQAYKQCEGACILAKSGNAINISGIERFVADHTNGFQEKMPALNGKKIAIVGAGPAGLTAALDFRKKGYFIVIFEAEKKIGGLLVSAIPKYRLPEAIAEEFLNQANIDGIEIHPETRIGDDLLLNDFLKEFDAVLVASGEKIAKQLSVKGNDLPGVLYWDDFLKEFNGKIGKLENKKIIVIGGGDTAIDCSRIAIRNNAEVTIAYRKTLDFMPTQKREIKAAEEEGVKFAFLLSPLEFAGEKKLDAVVFEKVLVEKEHFVMSSHTERIAADLAVVAAGQEQDNELLTGTKLEGQLLQAHSSRTKLEKVFVAGDIVNKNKTVIHAIRSAKEAVKEIDDFLNGKSSVPEGITKI